MTQTVALVAVGAREAGAVGSRIGAFARGLVRHGWDVTVLAPSWPPTTPVERLLGHAPPGLRALLGEAGIEGDLRPVAGWRTRGALRDVAADVAIVSVPPFSLLGASATALDPRVTLVVDYRDPWNARHTPPLLARATRTIERRALRRAAAVIYAGGPTLGDLLVEYLRLPRQQVISVPNGFDPGDVEGLPSARVWPERNGQPLQLVMNGYWYGRNGPGILADALEHVGPPVAELTVIGGLSPTIAAHLHRAVGRPLAAQPARSRQELYQRLHEADAAVVTVDHASAVESRILAKVYDYLATGVPVIAVCPSDAALLQIPGAGRFHHLHHRDVTGLVTLLHRAARDRTNLRAGTLGEGPTRGQGVARLHDTLRSLCSGP